MTTPQLTSLQWVGGDLVPGVPLAALNENASGPLTILHTNDFHSSIFRKPLSRSGSR